MDGFSSRRNETRGRSDFSSWAGVGWLLQKEISGRRWWRRRQRCEIKNARGSERVEKGGESGMKRVWVSVPQLPFAGPRYSRRCQRGKQCQESAPMRSWAAFHRRRRRRWQRWGLPCEAYATSPYLSASPHRYPFTAGAFIKFLSSGIFQILPNFHLFISLWRCKCFISFYNIWNILLWYPIIGGNILIYYIFFKWLNIAIKIYVKYFVNSSVNAWVPRYLCISKFVMTS